MRLGLSTEAAPDVSLDELAAACVRRGIAAVEVVEGHGHGLSVRSTDAAIDAAARTLSEAGLAERVFRPALVAVPEWEPVAALSARLGARVLIPLAWAAVSGRMDAAAAAFDRAGGRLLIAHPSDPAHATAARLLVERCAPDLAALSWDADPDGAPLTLLTAPVLEAAGPQLSSIRLRGSGPEAAANEGKGIGALIASLTLRAWDGVLLLAPTDPARVPVWRIWLGRGTGWGCGSRTGNEDLVRLGTSAG
ncbi:MAG TPA: hypothetical protein VK936_04540 [Longimicrobiales bacterium]|nr:hypothetical protein [Longimicrobiales bacterium]